MDHSVDFNFQQVVKVIWYKAASPPQTDGSIVFARWRQCALPCGHIGATWRIRLNLSFLRPKYTTQTSNRTVQPFLHSSRQKVLILYNGLPFSPKCPFPWGSGSPSNSWFHGPVQTHNPNGISLGSAVFAGLTNVIDRPTDHATRSVRSTAMWPKYLPRRRILLNTGGLKTRDWKRICLLYFVVCLCCNLKL